MTFFWRCLLFPKISDGRSNQHGFMCERCFARRDISSDGNGTKMMAPTKSNRSNCVQLYAHMRDCVVAGPTLRVSDCDPLYRQRTLYTASQKTSQNYFRRNHFTCETVAIRVDLRVNLCWRFVFHTTLCVVSSSFLSWIHVMLSVTSFAK